MSILVKNKILKKAAKMVAVRGVDGISMRTLAIETGIAVSVLYHYFKNKDDLLYQMFKHTGKELGSSRSKLPPVKNSASMLKQRIKFQLDNAEDIVAILKYYFAYRSDFSKAESGFIPDRAYTHIVEVLECGVRTKEFKVQNIIQEAKIITHAINGFVLEYFPAKLSGKEKIILINSISEFLLKALNFQEKNIIKLKV